MTVQGVTVLSVVSAVTREVGDTLRGDVDSASFVERREDELGAAGVAKAVACIAEPSDRSARVVVVRRLDVGVARLLS